MAKSKDKPTESKQSKAPAAKSGKGQADAPTKSKSARKGAHAPLVLRCHACDSDSHTQDRFYGPGMRLHTVGEGKRTCSRCGLVTKV